MNRFTRREWDSKFFGREIFGGELNLAFTPEVVGDLRSELNSIRDLGCELLEVRLNSRYFLNVPILEDLGFRFVDSRLEFRTHSVRSEFRAEVPVGSLRWFKEDDWKDIQELTVSQFADNPNFFSRYNNREYFSRSESIRYYLQWHHWVLENPIPLFCIWERDGDVLGFYSVLRRSGSSDTPEYKVALAAVQPKSAAHGMQNQMQFWIFQNAPDEVWTTLNSPSLTNIAGLKNNIRAGKDLSSVEAYFYLRP